MLVSVGPVPQPPYTADVITRSTRKDAPVATFHARSEEVSLTLSVTDTKGRPVSGITSRDLSVRDDKQPIPELHLSTFHDLPLRLGLLVDWSDSVADGFNFERQTATDFLQRVMRSDYDQGFVVGFSDKWELTQPLTKNPEMLVRGLRQVEGNWRTSLYDALAAACEGEMSRPTSDRAVRRAIILLSDGQDNNSIMWLTEAIAAAQRADVAIYPVVMRGRLWDERGQRVLMQLAQMTGGQAYIVKSQAQYLAAFQKIEQNLRSGYTLSYKHIWIKRDGKFRPVEISVRDRKLRVHVRKGYFAPAE
jgi:VWFA-related protein